MKGYNTKEHIEINKTRSWNTTTANINKPKITANMRLRVMVSMDTTITP